MASQSWTRANTKRLILIGLGVTAAVGVGIALFNRAFPTEEKHVGTKDIAKFFAKKIKRNLEVKQGRITIASMADLFTEIRESIQSDLTKIEKDRGELRKKALKIGATEYTKAMTSEYDARENQLIERATAKFLHDHQCDPAIYQQSLNEIDTRLMMEQLEQQGAYMHPATKSKEVLLEILSTMKEAELQKALENPDVSYT